MKLSRRLSILTFLLMVALSACQTPSVSPTQNNVTDTPAVPAPTLSPTPEPVKDLTICTMAIPEDLFLYSGQRSAARSAILAMIQDDLFNEGAGILSEIPSQANGGLRLQPVSVEGGQSIVDARGELVVLKSGVSVRPSGCRDASCTLVWDGESALQMDEMVLTYHLVEGLTWSDGVPVTGADSVFSYQLAGSQDSTGLRWAEKRTTSYTAADERTVTWIGKPGFTTVQLEKFFWMPLPSHAADGSALADLPQFTTLPLSFGPFSIESFTGDSVHLIRNPYYYRLDEGLPILDEITVQAIGSDRDAAVNALQSGVCDVLDASFRLENNFNMVAALQADPAYEVLTSSTGSWEQLVLGIIPASYDDYFNPLYGDRPNFFGDVRTRQAIAMCLDREAILGAGLSAVTNLMPSFISEIESLMPEDAGLMYDPTSAMTLLESAGWRDHDLDPATPLQAWEVAGVPMGTSFSVTLVTDASATQKELADGIRDSLGQCGIDVAVTALPTTELYAPGPSGVVFGRQFDLTLIAWQPMPDLDCRYYQSWQTPTSDNQWIGTNIAGLVDDIYDQVCSTAALALPEEYDSALRLAEEEFIETLVAVPLFSLNQVMAFSSEGCSQKSILNQDDFFDFLEYYDVSGQCP